MLLSPEYDIAPRLHDIRDIVIKYARMGSDEELVHRAALYKTICNLTDITRKGLENALQAHYDGKIWLKPGSTIEEGASNAWELWIERSHGVEERYMTIYLYRKWVFSTVTS